MSIDKLIAAIPAKTPAERKTMQKRALARLQSGKSALIADAQKQLDALEAHDAAQDQARAAAVQSVVGQPLATRVLLAFQKDAPSDTEERLIKALLDNPDSTCAELSGKVSWAPNTWDMGFGAVCAQRAAFLRDLGGTPAQGKIGNLPQLSLQQRGEDGAIRYTMKPEAVVAFRQLGFRVKPT